jgi:hypothetical protein
MLSDTEAPPRGENISIRKPDPGRVRSWYFFVYLSTFSSHMRKFNSAAMGVSPSGENNFIRRRDADFLLISGLLILSFIRNHFRVIRDFPPALHVWRRLMS